MTKRMILIAMLCVFFSVGTAVTTIQAATIFGGSRILAVDKDQRTITFKTKEGQTWTLQVNDPNLLNRQSVAKDEQVTIEIDLDDRIINVVQATGAPAAPKTETEDR